jgi:hypothetical protein
MSELTYALMVLEFGPGASLSFMYPGVIPYCYMYEPDSHIPLIYNISAHLSHGVYIAVLRRLPSFVRPSSKRASIHIRQDAALHCPMLALIQSSSTFPHSQK